MVHWHQIVATELSRIFVVGANQTGKTTAAVFQADQRSPYQGELAYDKGRVGRVLVLDCDGLVA